MIREEVGLSLDKAGKEVLGHAAKIVLHKETTTIVGDGSTQEAVTKKIAQIKKLVEVLLYCPCNRAVLYLSICFFCYKMHVLICRIQTKIMRKGNLMKE